jgi:purine-binding chemotaxis protein CheW
MTRGLNNFESNASHAYLLYRCRNHLFGTPLSQVREVIPFRIPRKIPNTKEHYLGMINFRGQAIGVVELCFWVPSLGNANFATDPQSMILTQSESGDSIAVVVDIIDGVSLMESSETELQRSDHSGVENQAGIRMAKFAQGVATLVDLGRLGESFDVCSESILERAG